MNQHQQSRRSVKGSEGNWIDMQIDTFTNWVNANLRTRNMEIDSLETGFEDGVKLVNLYEVIAKRKLGKYFKVPKFNNQKMDNVTLVLKAAETDGVRIVSIDSDHIVNGNMKMILGLIWQLILRYQIGGSEDKGVKIALKKLLLIWLQHVIPEQRITNITTDWNDGIALCNLVNVMQTGLCPEYQHLNRDAPVENVTKGMKLAEEVFGIPQIISPTHMANPHVDELSMMTYLSYFTQDNGIGEKWTLNLVNGWNKNQSVSNFNTDWNDGRSLGSLVENFVPDARIEYSNDDRQSCGSAMQAAEERLNIKPIISPDEMANPQIPELAIMAYTVQFRKATPTQAPPRQPTPPPPQPVQSGHDTFSFSGTGVEEPKIGSVSEIYVQSSDNYPMDDLEVKVTGPDFNNIPVTYEDRTPDLRVYQYVPDQVGHHNVDVKYKSKHVPKSPVVVNAKNDLTKIRVHGTSLSGGSVNKPVEFDVDIGMSNALVEADVTGPGGTKPRTYVTNKGDGSYTVEFTPTDVGSHNVTLSVNRQKLPGEPIEIPIKESEEVVVESMQYKEDKHLYAELYERIGIAVDTGGSGQGTLTAETDGPSRNLIETDVEEDQGGNHTVSFTPAEIGEYRTKVYWNNKQIQGSPFVVWVSDPSSCVTSGDTLRQSRLLEDNHFQINTANAGPGKITAYAEKNGERSAVEVDRINENVYNCVFHPEAVGLYNVHVDYNEAPVKGSPFPVKVANPREVVVVESTETVVETTSVYTRRVKVNRNAGPADLRSEVRGPNGQMVSSEVKEVDNEYREVSFKPVTPGRYEVNTYYAGTLVQGCPYFVNVTEGKRVDSQRVRVSGNGIKEGVINDLCQIHVDARDAGAGHLSATVHGIHNDVVAGIRDNQNGTYDITYTPATAGAYVVDIKWDGEHVQGSPYRVTVENRAQPQSVIVGGDGIKEGTAGQPVLFTLDGRNAGPGQLSCRCRAPSGKMTYVLISDNKDGTYTVDLNASEPGLHTVEVEWDGQPIPGSPFLVRIMQAPDVNKVRAQGPGLESGLFRNFNGLFQVDSKGAGPGTMKVRIHGPKGAFKVEMYRDHPKDRSINVRYNPTEPGLYTANVFWSDEHIVGSPFEIFVAENERDLRQWKDDRAQVRQAEINGY